METIRIDGLRRLNAEAQIRMLQDRMQRRREQWDRDGVLTKGRIHIVIDEATLLFNENRDAVTLVEHIGKFGRKLLIDAELHVEGTAMSCLGGSPLIRHFENVKLVAP